MSGPTNQRRAEWAEEALAVYAKARNAQGEDMDTNIGDLLTDLQHLARRNGLKFNAIAARAKRMNAIERTEDQEDE